MSLFDDVIVNAAAAFDTVGKMATDVVDRSKVVVSSAELKNKISAQFETLGRYIYDTHESGNTDPAVVGQYVNEITDLINELKTLQDTLTSVSGKKICPRCACGNSCDSLFCKKCGASLDFSHAYTVGSQPNSQPVKEDKTAEAEVQQSVVEEAASGSQDDANPTE